jgi:hypothetical protein
VDESLAGYVVLARSFLLGRVYLLTMWLGTAPLAQAGIWIVSPTYGEKMRRRIGY